MHSVQGELFPPPFISLEEVFEAYYGYLYSCRKNKRHAANAARFEVDCEANLFRLWNEINNGEYRPGKSLAFIVERPVKREIFAADFCNRIVHHLIINRIKNLQVGLIISFNTLKVKHGIKKLTNNYFEPSALSASSAVKKHEGGYKPQRSQRYAEK